MEWDLGIRGVGLLLLMSIGFGLAVQLVTWRASPHWLWLLGTAAYFAIGVFVSEVWFGWATEEDLQPNIDGLSFDEVMLIATPLAVFAMFVAWLIKRRVVHHGHA